MNTEPTHIRCGARIIKIENSQAIWLYPSINAAKRASRALTQGGEIVRTMPDKKMFHQLYGSRGVIDMGDDQ